MKLESLRPVLNERVRRQQAAAEATVEATVEATALDRGGIANMLRATGLARNTIVTGIRELAVRPTDAAPVKHFPLHSTCSSLRRRL